jgi:hypothetical protein
MEERSRTWETLSYGESELLVSEEKGRKERMEKERGVVVKKRRRGGLA